MRRFWGQKIGYRQADHHTGFLVYYFILTYIIHKKSLNVPRRLYYIISLLYKLYKLSLNVTGECLGTKSWILASCHTQVFYHLNFFKLVFYFKKLIR